MAGVLSALVTLYAIYSALAVDFRANPALTILYCIFPGLTFFVFALVRSSGWKAAVLTLLAIGYLVTASALNWRTCAELGYCSTVASTVFQTLKTKPVLCAFAIPALSLILFLLRRKQHKTQIATANKESVVE